MSTGVKNAYVVSVGRAGNSGSAKRSRNASSYLREREYRRNEGRAGHNASTQASMNRTRDK